MTELSKKLIRLVVDELHDEKKGAPTIQDVITELNWAARDLERSALRLHIERCSRQRGGGFRECRARGIRKNHPALSG